MKKILIIGMADSIHTAHWVERIISSDMVVHFFPSRKYRKVHPLLLELESKFSNFELLKNLLNRRLIDNINYNHTQLLQLRRIGIIFGIVLQSILQIENYSDLKK